MAKKYATPAQKDQMRSLIRDIHKNLGNEPDSGKRLKMRNRMYDIMKDFDL